MNPLKAVRLAGVAFLLFCCQVLLKVQDHTWSKRMADSAIRRWPDGKVTKSRNLRIGRRATGFHRVHQFTIAANDFGSRLAPPTNAPSISG